MASPGQWSVGDLAFRDPSLLPVALSGRWPTVGRERDQEDTEEKHQLKTWTFQLDFYVAGFEIGFQSKRKTSIERIHRDR